MLSVIQVRQVTVMKASRDSLFAGFTLCSAWNCPPMSAQIQVKLIGLAPAGFFILLLLTFRIRGFGRLASMSRP